MIKSVPDNKYSFFEPEKSYSEMYQHEPVDAKHANEDYTVFRIKQTDSKHKLWFILDNNLVLPEYLVEFEYVHTHAIQSKIADFGDQICILDNEEDEFISPQNIEQHKPTLNSTYDALTEEANNYQFANIDEYQNYDIKAIDLERSDVSALKPQLINFLKYSLSRSIFYQLNPNLSSDEKIDVHKAIANSNTYLNLSNCEIYDLSKTKF